MSILERRSATRVKALRNLVDKGEYPIEYAFMKLDELNAKGWLTAKDYEDTFDYFDEILNRPEEIIEEPIQEETEVDTTEQNETDENPIENNEEEVTQ